MRSEYERDRVYRGRRIRGVPSGALPWGLVRPPTDTWWTWRGTRVHIARAADPSAAVRVMVIHGAGGHAGAPWPGAAVVAAQGAEVLAPDLPLYGRTEVRDPGNVRYRDWVDLLCELIVAEKASDPRPVILFGHGRLLAYEAAARTGIVDAVVATCLLDTADVAAREAAARWATLGRNAPRTLPAIAKVAGKLRVPIRWLTPMAAMSNNPALARLCASDPHGGGGRIPLGFLADWFDVREHRARGLSRTGGDPCPPRGRPLDVSGTERAVPEQDRRTDPRRAPGELRAFSCRRSRSDPTRGDRPFRPRRSRALVTQKFAPSACIRASCTWRVCT